MARYLFCAAAGVLVVAGCFEENQTTFFVEHMKAQAAAPQCETVAGDPEAPMGYFDLALGNAFAGYYYVRNQAVARDYAENLRAETDGILIKSMEVYVMDIEGEVLPATDEALVYEFPTYIPPETADLAYGVTVPIAVANALALENDCPTVGETWSQMISQIQNGQVPTPPEVRFFDPVYSVVRFLGVTNGGSEVETPEFSFLVEPCCNCLVNWLNCASACQAFCEEPEETGTCIPGVANGVTTEDMFDCRILSYYPDASWPSPEGSGVENCDTCG